MKLLGGNAPQRIFALGNLQILRNPLLALFCSSRCPGSVILKTYDLMCSLRNSGVTVISGFHSPIEKECLRLLLRGSQPIVICPARSIERMRVPTEWRDALAADPLGHFCPSVKFPAAVRKECWRGATNCKYGRWWRGGNAAEGWGKGLKMQARAHLKCILTHPLICAHFTEDEHPTGTSASTAPGRSLLSVLPGRLASEAL